jgi:hypothetical protein
MSVEMKGRDRLEIDDLKIVDRRLKASDVPERASDPSIFNQQSPIDHAALGEVVVRAAGHSQLCEAARIPIRRSVPLVFETS